MSALMNVLVPELDMFRTLSAPPVPTAGPAMTLVVAKTQATDPRTHQRHLGVQLVLVPPARHSHRCKESWTAASSMACMNMPLNSPEE